MSLAALEMALKEIPVINHGVYMIPRRNNPVDTRYEAMPSLTKKDYPRILSEWLRAAGCGYPKRLGQRRIFICADSGTTDDKSLTSGIKNGGIPRNGPPGS